MNNGEYTEIEKFILSEFFAGRTFSVLVRDYLDTHEVTRAEAEKLIYNCLKECALNY